jgi:hypothetical protein
VNYHQTHGGVKGWTDEQILTNASVLAMRNQQPPRFTTSTCDFSTLRQPRLTSAGEQSLTDNYTGGAVGPLHHRPRGRCRP